MWICPVCLKDVFVAGIDPETLRSKKQTAFALSLAKALQYLSPQASKGVSLFY